MTPEPQASPDAAPTGPPGATPFRPLGGVEAGELRMVDEDDPAVVVLTCANCGAALDERKCKLVCRCGYFLSCSDYY